MSFFVICFQTKKFLPQNTNIHIYQVRFYLQNNSHQTINEKLNNHMLFRLFHNRSIYLHQSLMDSNYFLLNLNINLQMSSYICFLNHLQNYTYHLLD